jgi:hypothetical protein
VRDTADPLLADLLNELRALLQQVRREREAVFRIVIESNHAPSMHRLAAYLEADQHHSGTVLH